MPVLGYLEEDPDPVFMILDPEPASKCRELKIKLIPNTVFCPVHPFSTHATKWIFICTRGEHEGSKDTRITLYISFL